MGTTMDPGEDKVRGRLLERPIGRLQRPLILWGQIHLAYSPNFNQRHL